MQKQKTPLLRSKFGKQFGFKGVIAPKKEVGPTKPISAGFDPARFKTQHKG